jgi:serine/threonine protein kinase
MAKQQNMPLPSGTRLQQYSIDRVISTGGFSIVYLGYNELGIPVAIKEFMPAGMKLRQSGEEATIASKEDDRRFQMGMRGFFKEAEAISRLDDRSVVKILNFFLANNTAYLVMPFEHGRTLQKMIVSEHESMHDSLVQRIFCDVLQGICVFHSNDILHLDLKPSNIWIRADGTAMIIDFGTSRIGREGKNHLPPMHTPGFAAPEQHRKFYRPDKIGIWTDIYNFGATIYSCIEGEPPIIAEDRMEYDTMPRLEQRWAGQYSAKMLRMVDKMLRLDPDRRPQEAAQILESMSRYTPMPERDAFSDHCRRQFYTTAAPTRLHSLGPLTR